MVAINYLLTGGFIFVLLIFIFIFIMLQLKNKQKQRATATLQHVDTPIQQPATSIVPTSAPPPDTMDPRVRELRDFISARLASGYTKEQLYNALQSKGWDATTLDKAFKGF